MEVLRSTDSSNLYCIRGESKGRFEINPWVYWFGIRLTTPFNTKAYHDIIYKRFYHIIMLSGIGGRKLRKNQLHPLSTLPKKQCYYQTPEIRIQVSPWAVDLKEMLKKANPRQAQGVFIKAKSKFLHCRSHCSRVIAVLTAYIWKKNRGVKIETSICSIKYGFGKP